MSKPDMILRSNVINLFNCKRLRYFQYKMVNITVKQARMQNGTFVELNTQSQLVHLFSIISIIQNS